MLPHVGVVVGLKDARGHVGSTYLDKWRSGPSAGKEPEKGLALCSGFLQRGKEKVEEREAEFSISLQLDDRL